MSLIQFLSGAGVWLDAALRRTQGNRWRYAASRVPCVEGGGVPGAAAAPAAVQCRPGHQYRPRRCEHKGRVRRRRVCGDGDGGGEPAATHHRHPAQCGQAAIHQWTPSQRTMQQRDAFWAAAAPTARRANYGAARCANVATAAVAGMGVWKIYGLHCATCDVKLQLGLMAARPGHLMVGCMCNDPFGWTAVSARSTVCDVGPVLMMLTL